MKTKNFNRLFLSLLVAIIMIFMQITVFNNTIIVSAENENNESTSEIAFCIDKESASEVVSYIDIFQNYYDIVLKAAEEAGKNEICTFEEFCDKYYYCGMDLPRYTDSVILRHVLGQYENNDSTLMTEESVSEAGNSVSLSSPDADYVLSSYDYASTPASVFARVPAYSYNYSALQDGDIVHETITIFGVFGGHTALVYNTSKSSEYGSYIQTIEAVGSGVKFAFLDDTRMVEFGVIILRASGATASIIDSTKYFSYMQLGKPYTFDPIRLSKNIGTASWYCSEMVYAAYLYGGINIAPGMLLGCMPQDIYNSNNTYTAFSFLLDISVFSKSGSKWTIKIINNYTENITFYYNSKMCFESDAKHWSGLKDIVTSSINAQSHTYVVISENWFATSVVVSRLAGKRLITYGYKLDNSKKTMTVEYAIKSS